MPDLFPASASVSNIATNSASSRINFGSSFKFDFDTGEFALTPTGQFVTTKHIDAWVEWCKKALLTTRYRFLAYSRNYGQEFENLIGQGLARKAIESEIKRMAKECLLADPRTAAVKNFTFAWGEESFDSVEFSCEIYNVLGESAKIDGSAVMS